MNEKNVGAVGFDVACHVISVGTCCPNSHIQSWASSSAVKREIAVPVKVRVQICEKTDDFLHKIKLNWLWWSPSGVHLDYMWSPARVLRDWIRSPGIVSILMDSIGSPLGVQLEFSRIL